MTPRTENAVFNIDLSAAGGGSPAGAALQAPRPASPKVRPAAQPPVKQPAADAPVAEPDPGVPAAAPVEQAQDGAAGGAADVRTEIGWENAARVILTRGVMSFPRILSAEGQEVELEARITVTPQGMVSNVEIIRGSGYTEIDAGVKAALRGYVFTPASKYAIGTVKFRFRLERFD